MTSSAKPEFDLVLLGATGFTGRLLAEYLLSRHGADGDLRWALAGRNEDKLKAVRSELGSAAESLPVLTADSHDRASLDALCARTAAICSTVGPYALHGSDLVAACAASGTDYCDLTGEVPWMRRMLDAHEAAARESGARLVHCCGFDSIPSDLGVAFLQRAAVEQLGQPLTKIRMGVERMRGTMSGGTAASMINIIEETRENPEVARVAKNPYALCPEGAREGVRQPYVKGPEYDDGLDSWLSPFVMAAINTRIVHRSHALQGHPWGSDFHYDEAMMTGRGFGGRRRAWGWSLALGGFAVGASLKPTRRLMASRILPKPGEGPSAEQREKGFFRLLFDGRTADGKRLRARVTGDRDPGYGSTAKMLGEAAFTLATDLPRDAVAGGFWTPSTALGERLEARLVKHAGLTFELVEER
ncbi:MAG: saccharopine dehydrogenase [Wenzhouxiangella sp.]|nr:MAG: saccharopine dehydrogenase [Wenzhouxiangella sp.]